MPRKGSRREKQRAQLNRFTNLSADYLVYKERPTPETQTDSELYSRATSRSSATFIKSSSANVSDVNLISRTLVFRRKKKSKSKKRWERIQIRFDYNL